MSGSGGAGGTLGGTGGASAGSAGTGGVAGSGGTGAAGTGGSSGGAGRGGAAGGRGGSGGGSAGRGGTGGGSAGTGGGTGGTGGRKSCQGDTDCQGFKCCGGFCVNPGNDILNCGMCGKSCSGDHPYCDNGTCQTDWPCKLLAACNQGATCCGGQCCTGTQICCTVTLGPSVTGCFEPVNGTCPTGCSGCNCASPTTPIATPAGDRPIADLKVGDLVYSLDRGSLAVVPIKLVHRQPVTGSHRVVELKLAHGPTLRISPRHPTADGRHFSDLVAGDVVDGVRVSAARLVDYDQPFTYDILPDSDSGTYFAGGTLIGSTLSNQFGDVSTTPTAVATSVRHASVLLRVER